jgi:hypothetical protein
VGQYANTLTSGAFDGAFRDLRVYPGQTYRSGM